MGCSLSAVNVNLEIAPIQARPLSVKEKVCGVFSSLITSLSARVKAFSASMGEIFHKPALDLTVGDQLRTGTNLVRWGLIGAGFYGISPAILIPMNVLTSLSAEILLFCSLPKDASWLKKALSIPVLSNAIIQYNPWVARMCQGISLYNLLQHSKERLGSSWKKFKGDPKKALQEGAIHGFNLASGLLFAAKNAGLIRLAPLPAEEPEEDPLRPEEDPPGPEEEPPEPGDFPPVSPIGRSIKWATIYDNKGNAHREEISDLVVKNHRAYAKQWGLESEVIDHSLVQGKCELEGKQVDCSPYFNKLAYLMQQCKSDRSSPGHEKWVIYADDDLLVTNPNINPWRAIDALRGGQDTSVIMAQEGADWIPLYPLPGFKEHDPRVAINSGFIIARMDDKGCGLIEKAWNHRNTPTDSTSWNYPDCKTVGSCKNQYTVLNDQAAVAMALQEDLSVINRDVTILLPRDTSSKTRPHIAFNTLHRDGCTARGQETNPYDIGTFDRKNYPDGQWRKGDWVGQTAGFPVTGRYPLPTDAQGNCVFDANIPIENVRLKKLLEMVHQTPKQQHFTLGMTYTPTQDLEADYAQLTTENHKEYARVNHASFRSMTGDIRMDCDFHGRTEQCVPYWRKIFEIDRFLREPNRKNTEEWYVYADEDGVYGDMTLSLHQVLKDLQGQDDASILVAKDLRDDLTLTNTGILFVRKDEASRAFVKEWIEMRNAPSGKRECPTLGTCSQDYSLHEQEALNRLLKGRPGDKTVKVVDIRASDRPYGVNSLFRQRCFQGKMGESFMSDRPYNPSGISQPGDFYMQPAGVPRMGLFCRESAPPHPLRKEFIRTLLSWVKK